MFDTHCHLNFSAFKKNLDEVIKNAKKAGVNYFVIPGTDYESSKRAVEIAEQYDGVYAAVGIHPHHVFEYSVKRRTYNIKEEIQKIETLTQHQKVVAIGEIGIDRHYYHKTKYKNYKVNEEFIEIQKSVLIEQIVLAKKYEKALIIHNREAKNDLLEVLTDHRLLMTGNRIVFHCCEADDDLLDFAVKNHIYIGVDGDVTYSQDKQEFVKKIPLELLVLETDSPFLKPRGTKYPNEPRNLPLITEYITKLLKKEKEEIERITTENAKKLFSFKSREINSFQ